MKAANAARQGELHRWARRRGWDRGPFRSWSNGSYTVTVAAQGYPRRKFSIVNRRTADSRLVDDLEDIERFQDFVRVTGQEPGE
jgi:hypothetical protein